MLHLFFDSVLKYLYGCMLWWASQTFHVVVMDFLHVIISTCIVLMNNLGFIPFVQQGGATLFQVLQKQLEHISGSILLLL